MSDFIGRGEQLTFLHQQLATVRKTKRAAFLSIRGRRRIGKSRLIEEFIRTANTPAVFYCASNKHLDIELTRFLEEIQSSNAAAAKKVAAGPTPTSWGNALRLLSEHATAEQPLILVLDEFPYLTTQRESIEGTLQATWEMYLKNQPILLILAGSDLATMEAIGAYDRPLYGRARELVIRPLTPYEIAAPLTLPAADALDSYLITGGFPELAEEWQKQDGDIWKYLETQLSSSASPLVVNGERSLQAELPADLNARAVLLAIGAGACTFQRISSRSGTSKGTLERTLQRLLVKRMVERITPYSCRTSKSAPRWLISDPLLRFWLRYIEPNLNLLERQRSDLAVKKIRSSWEAYRGQAIEPLLRESLIRFIYDNPIGDTWFIGGYWTRDSKVEVDLVGGDKFGTAKKLSFIGSIKWRQNEPFTRQDLSELEQARDKVPGTDQQTPLVAISRSGFQTTDGLAATPTPDELLAAWKPLSA